MLKNLLFLSLILSVEANKVSELLYSPCSWPTSLKFLGFSGGLISSYWGVTQLHTYYCAPSGIYGFFQTALLMSTPVCRTCISVLSSVDNIYGAVWTGVLLSGMNLLKEISVKITKKEV
tara:strand:+ start:390 stop:746 length:357 start_codon:yes stop_codon:yes gene_type:complete